jgi:hypothetical protein
VNEKSIKFKHEDYEVEVRPNGEKDYIVVLTYYVKRFFFFGIANKVTLRYTGGRTTWETFPDLKPVKGYTQTLLYDIWREARHIRRENEEALERSHTNGVDTYTPGK